MTLDRATVRPGEEILLSLMLEGSAPVSVLHCSFESSIPLLPGDLAAAPLLYDKKQVRCGPNGCLLFSEDRALVPGGEIAKWLLTIPHAALKGPIDIRVRGISASGPDGNSVEVGATEVFTADVIEDGAPMLLGEGIVNAATYQPGLSSGGLATLFGTGFSMALTTEYAQGAREHRGLSVLINGIAAPLLSIGRSGAVEQINLQVPFEIQPGLVEIEVRNGDRSGRANGVLIEAWRPGIFEVRLGEARFGAVRHADGQLVTPEFPAQYGETLSVYLTGGGPLAGTVATGQLGPIPPVPLTSTVRVSVDGVPCLVTFAGYAPQLIGVYQVNVEMPQISNAGTAPLQVEIGGVQSNPVQLPIQ
jgi:uncharacterized protein (TIGR03437 family)